MQRYDSLKYLYNLELEKLLRNTDDRDKRMLKLDSTKYIAMNVKHEENLE